jgi:hypothetical protein
MATAWELLTAGSTVSGTNAWAHLKNQGGSSENRGPLEGAIVQGIEAWSANLLAIGATTGTKALNTNHAVAALHISDAMGTLKVDAINDTYHITD